MKAIVYMMKETGMMCSQRWERIRVGSSLSSVTSKLMSALQSAGDGEGSGETLNLLSPCDHSLP
jgi:hypothetical protein